MDRLTQSMTFSTTLVSSECSRRSLQIQMYLQICFFETTLSEFLPIPLKFLFKITEFEIISRSRFFDLAKIHFLHCFDFVKQFGRRHIVFIACVGRQVCLNQKGMTYNLLLSVLGYSAFTHCKIFVYMPVLSKTKLFQNFDLGTLAEIKQQSRWTFDIFHIF